MVQQLNHCLAALLLGAVQRRLALLVGSSHAGTVADEHLESLDRVSIDGVEESRPTFIVINGLAARLELVEEHDDDIGRVVGRGHHQRRPASLVHRLDVRSHPHEGSNRLNALARNGKHQAGRTRVALQHGVQVERLQGTDPLDLGDVVLLDRLVQRLRRFVQTGFDEVVPFEAQIADRGGSRDHERLAPEREHDVLRAPALLLAKDVADALHLRRRVDPQPHVGLVLVPFRGLLFGPVGPVPAPGLLGLDVHHEALVR